MNVTLELGFPHGVEKHEKERIEIKAKEAVSMFADSVTVVSHYCPEITMVHGKLDKPLPYKEACDRVADTIYAEKVTGLNMMFMLEDPRFGKFTRGYRPREL